MYLRYNSAAGVITMSQASRDRLVGIGLDSTKVHVVPYGVGIPDKPVVRSARANVSCLAVGRMVAKKAPIFLLESFRRASSKNRHLRLDYVGDGPLMPAVRQFIAVHSLEEKVVLHREQPNSLVLKKMVEADLFLQHSMADPDTGDEEGLPVAILEAMAHGVPVLSTRHAGIPEAVLDGETGFLSGEGEFADMADHILALCEQSELRSAMGRAGWERARSLFSWTREKEELLRLMDLDQVPVRR